MELLRNVLLSVDLRTCVVKKMSLSVRTLVKSRVRTVSSPVVEETNMSSELNAAAPTRRHTQVKLVLPPWTQVFHSSS